MFHATWAGQPLVRHLGTQGHEDLSDETGWTTLDLVVSGHELVRMSQAKQARPPNNLENVLTRGPSG
eukprot:4002423-Pyramimonas_sp.AAC.1